MNYKPSTYSSAGQKYFQQQLEMVRDRINMRLGKLIWWRTANPMTAKEAIKELHQTKKFINSDEYARLTS